MTQVDRVLALHAGAARAATVVVSIIVAAGSFAATDGGAG